MKSLIIWFSFLIISFFNQFLIAQEKCDILPVIFKEESIKFFIDKCGDEKTIRIFDLSNYFNKIDYCGYEGYSVKIENKLMIDMNSLRYIDITILSHNFENEILTFELFYSERTQNCNKDYLMLGNIVCKKGGDGKFTFINSWFAPID